MSRNHRLVECRCDDESESEAKREDDSTNALQCTRDSTVEIRKVDTTETLTDSAKTDPSSRYVTFKDAPERRPSAIEVLKKIDADKIRRISLQNIRLSAIFPEARATHNDALHCLLSFIFFVILTYCKIKKYSILHRCSGLALNRLKIYHVAPRLI